MKKLATILIIFSLTGCANIPENEVPNLINETKQAELKEAVTIIKTGIRKINSNVKKPQTSNDLAGAMQRALAAQLVYDAKEDEFMDAGITLCRGYAINSIENFNDNFKGTSKKGDDYKYFQIGTVHKNLYLPNVYCRVSRIFNGSKSGYNYIGINVKVLINDTLVKDFGDLK